MPPIPLVEAWRRAMAGHRRPLQIPGHKNRYATGEDVLGADLLAELVRDDIPLQGGVDDNAFSNRYLEQAEDLWAAAVGSDHVRFLVGGSSQGNIAALSTVGHPDRPGFARSCTRSSACRSGWRRPASRRCLPT